MRVSAEKKISSSEPEICLLYSRTQETSVPGTEKGGVRAGRVWYHYEEWPFFQKSPRLPRLLQEGLALSMPEQNSLGCCVDKHWES